MQPLTKANQNADQTETGSPDFFSLSKIQLIFPGLSSNSVIFILTFLPSLKQSNLKYHSRLRSFAARMEIARTPV